MGTIDMGKPHEITPRPPTWEEECFDEVNKSLELLRREITLLKEENAHLRACVHAIRDVFYAMQTQDPQGQEDSYYGFRDRSFRLAP